MDDCKKALIYANGDTLKARAYLKAKSLPVVLKHSKTGIEFTFEERVEHFYYIMVVESALKESIKLGDEY